MPALFFLACLFVIPAILTWGLVRLMERLAPTASRKLVILACIPPAALLPLLPASLMVARAQMINNAVPIALVGTIIVGCLVGLFVCLPVALALTRR